MYYTTVVNFFLKLENINMRLLVLLLENKFWTHVIYCKQTSFNWFTWVLNKVMVFIIVFLTNILCKSKVNLDFSGMLAECSFYIKLCKNLPAHGLACISCLFYLFSTVKIMKRQLVWTAVSL